MAPQLEALIHRKFMVNVRQEGERRKVAESLFRFLKNHLTADYGAYIRNAAEMRARGIPMPPEGFTIPWVSAALVILEEAPEDIVSDFMRGERATKDEFVQAVLKDGGIEALNGFFVRVPEV